MARINFFTEGITYPLKHKIIIKKWIEATIVAEGYKLAELNLQTKAIERLIWTDPLSNEIEKNILTKLKELEEKIDLIKSNTELQLKIKKVK